MNIDNLHDALNLLDDELIEEVEVLRSKRKVDAQKRGKKWIFRYASLAAGLLLFVVSAYAVGTLFLRGFGSVKKSDSSVMIEENTVGDNIKEESTVDKTGDADENALPSQQESTVNDNSSTVTGESKSEAREIKVEVTALVREGFVGIVKESDDKEMYGEGTELTVVLLEEKLSGGSSTVDMQYKEYAADDVAFPVGSVVIVRFMQQNVIDTEGEEITLYADEITFD